MLLGVLIGVSAVAVVLWPRQAHHPNLLILTIDTTRSDHLGAYGYHRDTSPYIDALAARGVLFEHHVVPQATTLPSHLSLFTGVYPDEHGVVGNSDDGQRFVIPEGLTPLAVHLEGAGYATAAFVSATPLKRSSGLDHGFQVYDQPGDKSRPGDKTVDAALAWLGTAPEEPWLLWVHVFDPHLPYRARGEPFSRDDPQRDQWLAERKIPVNSKHQTRVDGYDREIRFADSQLGRVLAATRGAGPTVVLLAGDHGEGMGEHNHYEHGRVWKGELEAPLVIAAPGLTPQRIAAPTSTVDVLPTLLGVAEWPDEQALLEQVTGVDVRAQTPAPRGVVSRTSLRQSRLRNRPKGAIPVRWALTTAQWTFVMDDGGRELLYDRANNPFELGNDLWKHPDVADALRAELLERRAAFDTRAQALGAGQIQAADADERAELEALGYLE